EVADGTTVNCDLVVTAVGWTAPTSLLNMAGNRPAYDPRAARFFPDPDTLPPDVLVTGGITGDGGLEELSEHATATGAEAARRALAIARARRAATPTSAAAGPGAAAGPPGIAAISGAAAGTAASATPIRPLPVEPHPELFMGRTHGMVDFSEDVSTKDLAG